MIEVNGIAHVFVTVGDFARAREFYSKLLPFLGMKPVLDGEGFYYCVGGRTAFGLRPAGPGDRWSTSARRASAAATSARTEGRPASARVRIFT